jgi:hypothetical protein
MANLRAWRGTAAGASNLPQLKFKAEIGHHIVVPVGGTEDYATVLREGTQIVLDFGCFWEGEVAFSPKFDDARMRLRGTELPPFSNDQGYHGGIKLNVMVQYHGLCSMLSTSEAVTRAVDAMYDAFVFAAEAQAGQLPAYRIGNPRSYQSRYSSNLLYAPIYLLAGWLMRGDAFGPRLIPPPKPILVPEVITAPASLEAEKVFGAVSSRGEVISAPSASTAQRRKGKRQRLAAPDNPQADPDLDDVVPF